MSLYIQQAYLGLPLGKKLGSQVASQAFIFGGVESAPPNMKACEATWNPNCFPKGSSRYAYYMYELIFRKNPTEKSGEAFKKFHFFSKTLKMLKSTPPLCSNCSKKFLWFIIEVNFIPSEMSLTKSRLTTVKLSCSHRIMKVFKSWKVCLLINLILISSLPSN